MSKKSTERKVNNLHSIDEVVADVAVAEIPATVEVANVETSNPDTSMYGVPDHGDEALREEQLAHAETPVDPLPAAAVEVLAEAESVPEVGSIMAAAIEAPEITKTDLQTMIETLRKEINELKSNGSKRVASGSKPRPNVIYQLLKRPATFHKTPQVAQLQQIIFDPTFVAKHTLPDGTVKVPEPELFEQIAAGQAAGILRTRQMPVRILQYYRNTLMNADCLRWQ